MVSSSGTELTTHLDNNTERHVSNTEEPLDDPRRAMAVGNDRGKVMMRDEIRENIWTNTNSWDFYGEAVVLS